MAETLDKNKENGTENAADENRINVEPIIDDIDGGHAASLDAAKNRNHLDIQGRFVANENNSGSGIMAGKEYLQDLKIVEAQDDIMEIPVLDTSICSKTAQNEEIKNTGGICPRRVSFPKHDKELVTGYLEPANPWRSVSDVKSADELIQLYTESCHKHGAEPLSAILEQMRSIKLSSQSRYPCLNLRDTILTPESCEALEEIFKRIQYNLIDLTACSLNDLASSALFDMIEFYEAAIDLDISENPDISNRGWQSCISMIRRSRALQSLIVRGTVLSEINANNLGKSLSDSVLHTIKLEHCGLTGRPITSLCVALKSSSTLKELWLAYNDLSEADAQIMGEMLKGNHFLQFLDISNNNLQNNGVKHIVIALIEQASRICCTAKSSAALSVFTSSRQGGSTTNSAAPANFENEKELSSTVGRSMLESLLNKSQRGEAINIASSSSSSNSNNPSESEMIRCNNNVAQESHETERTTSDQTSEERALTPSFNVNQSRKTENSIKESVQKPFEKEQNIPKDFSLHNNNVVVENDAVEPAEKRRTVQKDLDENKNKGTEIITDTKNESTVRDDTTKDVDLTASDMQNIFTRPAPPTPPSTKTTAPENLQQSSPKLVSVSNSLLVQVPHLSNIAEHARSPSTESLNSENSIEISSDSKLSARNNEKLTKNDTLGRQKHGSEEPKAVGDPVASKGLQGLVLWNNNLSRDCGEYISDLLATTHSLEFLNIGKNILSNDFIQRIEKSLLRNYTLNSFGLQSAHLNCNGIKTLTKVLGFGGNTTLRRIDLRDNNIQVAGLTSLIEVVKSNKSINRIDLDEIPKRLPEDEKDTQFTYTKLLQELRSLCKRNETADSTPAPTIRGPSLRTTSRKISLTCHSVRPTFAEPKNPVRRDNSLLDVKRKGTKLRSPLPSPPTSSPSSSPVPSPSRNRFQVFRVEESNKTQSAPAAVTLPQKAILTVTVPSTGDKGRVSPRSRFRVTPTRVQDLGITTTEPKLSKTLPPVLAAKPMSGGDLGKRSASAENILSSARVSSLYPLGQLTDDSFSSNSSIDSSAFSQTSEESLNFEEIDASVTNLSESKLHTKPSDTLPPSTNTLKAEEPSYLGNIQDPEKTIGNEQSFEEKDRISNKEIQTLDEGKIVTCPQQSSEATTRKLSWIAGPNYATTVDKLLSIFHNPANIFARPVDAPPPPPPDPNSCADNTTNETVTDSKAVATRKESPASLFAWPILQQSTVNNSHKKSSSKISEITTATTTATITGTASSFLDAASKQIKGIADFGKQVLKQNFTLGDSIKLATASSTVHHQPQQMNMMSSTATLVTSIENPIEIKENISPENTITVGSAIGLNHTATTTRQPLDSCFENHKSSVNIVSINTGTNNTTTTTTTTSNINTQLMNPLEKESSTPINVAQFEKITPTNIQHNNHHNNIHHFQQNFEIFDPIHKSVPVSDEVMTLTSKHQESQQKHAATEQVIVAFVDHNKPSQKSHVTPAPSHLQAHQATNS